LKLKPNADVVGVIRGTVPLLQIVNVADEHGWNATFAFNGVTLVIGSRMNVSHLKILIRFEIHQVMNGINPKQFEAGVDVRVGRNIKNILKYMLECKDLSRWMKES
jgi:hypothetical protein